MAGAEPGDGLGEEEEQHRACTAQQGHTCWGCGELDRGLPKEDTGQNVTLPAVG